MRRTTSHNHTFTYTDLGMPKTLPERVAELVRERYDGTPVRTRDIARALGKPQGEAGSFLRKAAAAGLVKNVFYKGWVPVD